TEYILEGNVQMGMPSFKAELSAEEARALVIYMQEIAAQTSQEREPPPRASAEIVEADGVRFRLETVVEGLDIPWAVAFLPTGGMLITERQGSLRQFVEGELLPPVEGMPEIWARGQGGLMEVALHPNYAENGLVYLAYSEPSESAGNEGMTAIARGRIVDNRWTDHEMIFEVPERFHNRSGVHFGTRLVFQDGYLFFPIGDRGAQQQAQDLSRPNGKIHRIHDDGRIPEDNPFVDQPDAFPSIWTYGNRNPQGLDLDPATGLLWSTEHGPRGGDELNLIERGNNYGWPVITYGMNYSGRPITDQTHAPGMEQPKLHWTPSIAVCGMDFYEGEAIPEWTGQLFTGGLASEQLHRIVIDGREVKSDTIVLKGAGRVRDVQSGLDGHLYLVLNSPDSIVRLVPADSE
ncbi:MAG: PQQ-dependent sugar dehydrogenase, partial [Verrucomicrobiota bacterium]